MDIVAARAHIKFATASRSPVNLAIGLGGPGSAFRVPDPGV